MCVDGFSSLDIHGQYALMHVTDQTEGSTPRPLIPHPITGPPAIRPLTRHRSEVADLTTPSDAPRSSAAAIAARTTGTFHPHLLILVCIICGAAIGGLTLWLATPFLPPVPDAKDAVAASKSVVATVLIPGVIHSLIASSLFLAAAVILGWHAGRRQRLTGAIGPQLRRGDVRIGLGDRPLGAGRLLAGLTVLVILYAGLLSYVQFRVIEDFFAAVFRAGFGLRLSAFLVLGLLAPIAEEMMFRGWLWTGLRRSWPPFTCSLVSGGLWLLTHVGEGTAKMAILAPVALLLGLARDRSASLRAPVLLHIALNLTSLVTPFILRALATG